MSTPHTDLQWT